MTIRKQFSRLLWKLPPPIRDFIRNIRRSSIIRKKNTCNHLYIQIFDGSTFHGGITDRFKGIISSYLFCKIKNIKFKINHSHPFELTTFLESNTYNWILNCQEEKSNSIYDTKLLDLIGDPTIRRLKKINTRKQIHCYSNRDVIDELNTFYDTNYTWGELFNELFKPTNSLEKALVNYREKIGGTYYAVVFRFQNLLGDFKEYNDVSELSSINKKLLIEKCKRSIIDLKKRLKNKNILVTSDSKGFLEEVDQIEGIFRFPEDVVHIDNSAGNAIETYRKTFLDFYLLSESLAIYSIGTPKMYKTEFPMYAAKLNNIPFKRIVID